MTNDERYMILPYKQRVTGSNPVAPTHRESNILKLPETPDL